MSRIRLIVDPPATGSWNMAVDEALLRTTPETGITTLRFYQWAEPTLSLGYFQRHGDRQTHQASLGCNWLRRATGGGAILHDRELTYSLTVPLKDPRASKISRYFDGVHAALLQGLAALGMTAALNGSDEVENSGAAPFLCFLRRSPVDVILADQKICGSAQRRQAGAMLQHGSLLLSRSPFAPELPGLNDLSGDSPVSVESIREVWLEGLRLGLGFHYDLENLSPAEMELSGAFQERKFQTAAWNERR